MWSRMRGAVHQWWLRRRGQVATIGTAAVARDDQKLVMGLSPARIPTAKQLPYLLRVLSAPEKRLARWLTIVAVLALLVELGSLAWRHIVRLPRPGGTLTEGLVGIPQFINPALALPNTVDDELVRLAFRGLMRTDDQLRVVPDLAQTFVLSDDGKTYTATLKPDLRWSDGEALTAQDVKFTFDTIADGEYKSPWQSWFTNVQTNVIDERTVTFTLAKPLSPFPSYLTIGLLPQHAWSDATPQAFSLAELNTKPIGTGPYRFQSVTKDRSGNIKSYAFVPNKYFSGSAPLIKKIIFKLYPDEFTATDALRNGSIDSLGLAHLPDDQKLSSLRRQRWPINQMVVIFFNQKNNAALKDREVRQALSQATDRPAIIAQILPERAQPALGPLLPGALGYDANIHQPAYDLEAAKKLLDQAGWKLNDKNIRHKDKLSLSVVLSAVDNSLYGAVADLVAEQWRQLGAQVEVKKTEAARITKTVIRPREYQALLFGQIVPADPDPFLFWDSSQETETGFNLAGYYNKSIDGALAIIRENADPAKRLTALRDFQTAMAAESPAVFLYQTDYIYLHRKNLRGFQTERLVGPSGRSLDIEHWYLTTRLGWGQRDKNQLDR